MLSLLSEIGLQAQVLVPLVLPSAYAILEDLGIREIGEGETEFIEQIQA